MLNQLIQKTELDNGVTVITDYMPEATLQLLVLGSQEVLVMKKNL